MSHNSGTGKYRPISDYAVIGDLRTAALVSSNASIDWCCLPRFDSPAVFCRILDSEKGGYFQVRPEARSRTTRSYVGGTNVLQTTFSGDLGQVRVTDFMPIGSRPDADSVRLLRLVEGLTGVVDMKATLFPTFDYARRQAELAVTGTTVSAQAGNEWLQLECPGPVRLNHDRVAESTFGVEAGDRFWFSLSYGHGASPGQSRLARDREQALDQTLSYWKDWSRAFTFQGPYADLVKRSALVLKLLTYEPTGAIVAAPTTSLPEQLGGIRNWDYRYTWLRDSALTLKGLMSLGYHDEAMRFWDWLQSLELTEPDRLSIMYRVDGDLSLEEHFLGHLEGYRGASPVRIGNQAACQKQLDIYGEVISAIYTCSEWMPEMRPLQPATWEIVKHLADEASRRWRETDGGIWEMRGEEKHYLSSKVMCWVALDRALRIVERDSVTLSTARWLRARDEVRTLLLSDGFNSEVGAFTQSLGSEKLDASVLRIPLVGLLPASDPRMRSTVTLITDRLSDNGLVHRYLDDEYGQTEGAFLICTFWLIENLVMQGQVERAEEILERAVGCANDVGLFSEEFDPANRLFLGNFPQAFSHLALVLAVVRLRNRRRELVQETRGD